MIKNPFVVTGYVAPEYFCDREKETAELVSNIENGRNTALISERRMGKTGLIEHVYHQPQITNHYYTFLVDIYSAGTLREFVLLLSKQIFETLKPRGRKIIDNFFAVISSLRTGFKLDPVTGVPMFDIGLGEILQPEVSLEQIFQYLESADKRCVVAIDEFQQIAKFPEKNVEALLRTHIQRCKNTHFIFAGSIHHMMRDIFFTASRPFYQSVSPMTLGPIEQTKYADFVVKFFQKAGMEMPTINVDFIYGTFWGHTWYMQRIFNEIFSITSKGEKVYGDTVALALKNIVLSYEPIYQNIVVNLTERQKEVLFAIAKETNATEVTSAEFIKKHGLQSSSSVQAAVKHLVAKEIIIKQQKRYIIPDYFFVFWLMLYYGPGFYVKGLSDI